MAETVADKAKHFVETVKAKGKEVAKKLHDDLNQSETLRRLEATTNVKKEVLVVLTVLLFILLFSTRKGARLLVNLAGFVYPAYASFRAIEEPDTKQNKVWLSYWIVFGFLSLLDEFTFLQNWIPFYFLIKLLLVIGLWHPKTHGAVLIKDRLVKLAQSHAAPKKAE